MVVHDPDYGTTTIASYGMKTTTITVPPSSKNNKSPGGRGLVSSRVQFFEETSNHRQSNQRQPAFFVEQLPKHRQQCPTTTTAYTGFPTGGSSSPPSMHSPNNCIPSVYAPAPSLVTPVTIESREPLSVTPPSRRRRYPDSFSNELPHYYYQQQHQLPVIEEHRQEIFFSEQSTLVESGTGTTHQMMQQQQKNLQAPKRKSSPLLEVGIDHYNRQEYVMAEKAFKTALKTEQANQNSDTLHTALIMGNLGAVYLKLNKLSAAYQFLQSSLAMKKKLVGKEEEEGNERVMIMLSDTYNNLGNCTYLLGQLDDSLDFYRLALQELREQQGQKSDVADTLFNIGRLEIYRGNLNRAHDILQEASRMAIDAYQDTNPVCIAEVSDLMGYVQLSLGKTEEAVISFTKSLEIHRILSGPIHLDVANAIFNIGLTREAAGDYMETWEAYHTVLDLHRRLGSSLGDVDFQKVRTSMAKVEKLIAQQQSQAQLVQKHQEAINKKKKNPKEKQRNQTEGEIGVVGNTVLLSGETRQL